jgi:hypothetical protein
MNKAIFIGDIIEENGKSIKENNLEKKHNIPIGSLVEIKWDEWHGNGACWKVHARLWVVSHDRDCDRTPLYSISRWSPKFIQGLLDSGFPPPLLINGFKHSGFSEESLIPIEITEDLKDGEGALEWKDDTSIKDDLNVVKEKLQLIYNDIYKCIMNSNNIHELRDILIDTKESIVNILESIKYEEKEK